jgi:hypothetical protein
MNIVGWSVRFAVDDSRARAISAMMKTPLAPELRGLTFSGPSPDDADEPSTITFEINAPDGNNARILAQHLLGKAKVAAGLKPDPSPVVWIAPLADDSQSSHRFLAAAEELVESGEYDLAVIAAQIHLEAHVSTLARLAAAPQSSPLAKAAVENQRAWAPHNRSAQPLLEAMFGKRVTAFPRWADYLAHVKRRNDVAHRGQSVDIASARHSMEIVSEFWLWLNDLAASARDGAAPSPASSPKYST